MDRMISKPAQGICHPSVGIDICLFAPWEPTNKKFFLPSASGLILFSMALLSRWILQSSKKGSIRGSRLTA
jgi:hypothetical protein